jgi:3-oxoacyl-[acyl-carrier protein] reductase
MSGLNGKIALVTGASRGIGKAIAQQLVADGATVIGTATSENGANAISDYLANNGTGIMLNVTDQASIDAMLSQIKEQYGVVDILVNNAGITRDNLLMRMKDDEWQDILDTNLTPIFKLSKAVLRGMMKNRHGRMINVIGFTKSMAREVASRGITVNVVAPGFIDTDMTKGLSDDQKDAIFKDIPANRLGDPKEIAATVAFLVSDGAAYITGETIHVNGGMHMS